MTNLFRPKRPRTERRGKRAVSFGSANRRPLRIESLEGRLLLSGAPPALYDYVVITSAALESSFQPLVAEKISRGLSAAIVTTDYIYANYTGTETHDNPDKIRQFIADSYANHGTQWVLLGGDVEVVPARGVYLPSGYGYPEQPADRHVLCLPGRYVERRRRQSLGRVRRRGLAAETST